MPKSQTAAGIGTALTIEPPNATRSGAAAEQFTVEQIPSTPKGLSASEIIPPEFVIALLKLSSSLEDPMMATAPVSRKSSVVADATPTAEP